MTIECALCNGKWESQEGRYLYHENNQCPLGDLDDVREEVVRSINTAIELARKDERLPEKCKWDESAGFCGQFGNLQQQICPCAAFEKKEG